MEHVEEIIASIGAPVEKADQELIERAYIFAAEAHKDQKRGSGEPYITHSVAVAKNCAALGMDITTIVGALLHDVLEDTPISAEEIKSAFGEEILFLVEGVTKLGTLKYRGRERHVESMRKFFVAMAEDIRVLVMKLADRLHNVQTLEHIPEQKRKRIALETIAVHAPLAGRLGMGKLKGLLEDYSFPHAYPKEYEQTKKLIDDIIPEAQLAVNQARSEIEKTLKEFAISASIDSRIKHIYSAYKKLQKYENNIEKLYDVVAIRVLVNSISDCYQVLGLVHMLWKPIPGRIKDYIALPKHNSYQSLHTTVVTPYGPVEVQIRTFEMHEIAELGIASHFLYKEKVTIKEAKVPKKLQWLDQLREIQTVVKNPSKFLEQLHLDLFRDRIFVFTPKGDVIDLPEDATPVDFAFAIHSEIGEKMSAAKINGKMASLSTKLKNGDIIEVVTSKNGKPSSKWLDFAKTTEAKKKIRNYIALHGGFIEKFLTRE